MNAFRIVPIERVSGGEFFCGAANEGDLVKGQFVGFSIDDFISATSEHREEMGGRLQEDLLDSNRSDKPRRL